MGGGEGERERERDGGGRESWGVEGGEGGQREREGRETARERGVGTERAREWDRMG